MIRAAIVVALVALAAPAQADDATVKKPRKPLPPYVPGPPDRWAMSGAEEANLEGTGIRSGFTFAVAFAPAIQIGVSGIEHATGTGGGFSFRLGRFANRDTIITIEICGTVFPYRYTTGLPPMEVEDHLKYNQSALATVGVQTFVAPTFWVRGAVGFASFTSRVEGGMRDITDSSFGAGMVLGAGIDLIRRKSLALGVELMTTGAIYGSGVILGGGLGLNFGIY